MLLNQTLSRHNFPCICGKVSLRSEVQAETSGLGRKGRRGGLPGFLNWGIVLAPPGPSLAPLHNAAPWFALGAIFGQGEDRVTHGRDSPYGEWKMGSG